MLIYNCLDSERGSVKLIWTIIALLYSLLDCRSKLTASSEGSDIVERITKLTTVDGAEWRSAFIKMLP